MRGKERKGKEGNRERERVLCSRTIRHQELVNCRSWIDEEGKKERESRRGKQEGVGRKRESFYTHGP